MMKGTILSKLLVKMKSENGRVNNVAMLKRRQTQRVKEYLQLPVVTRQQTCKTGHKRSPSTDGKTEEPGMFFPDDLDTSFKQGLLEKSPDQTAKRPRMAMEWDPHLKEMTFTLAHSDETESITRTRHTGIYYNNFSSRNISVVRHTSRSDPPNARCNIQQMPQRYPYNNIDCHPQSMRHISGENIVQPVLCKSERGTTDIESPHQVPNMMATKGANISNGHVKDNTLKEDRHRKTSLPNTNATCFVTDIQKKHSSSEFQEQRQSIQSMKNSPHEKDEIHHIVAEESSPVFELQPANPRQILFSLKEDTMECDDHSNATANVTDTASVLKHCTPTKPNEDAIASEADILLKEREACLSASRESVKVDYDAWFIRNTDQQCLGLEDEEFSEPPFPLTQTHQKQDMGSDVHVVPQQDSMAEDWTPLDEGDLELVDVYVETASVKQSSRRSFQL